MNEGFLTRNMMTRDEKSKKSQKHEENYVFFMKVTFSCPFEISISSFDAVFNSLFRKNQKNHSSHMGRFRKGFHFSIFFQFFAYFSIIKGPVDPYFGPPKDH